MGPWVTRLIVANVAMFMLSMAVPTLYRVFVLVPALALFRPWTVVTYMFLHGDLFHLLFNMLGLFFFGTRLEYRLGGRDFLLLYFISGVAGAVLTFFFTPTVPIIGASGAVFGIFIGFAMFWPDEPVYIWGVLPVPAKVLVLGMTLISLFSGFTGAQAGIAHFAHLGGFAGGWLYLKWWQRKRGSGWSPTPRPAQRPLRSAASAARDSVARWEAIPREELHEINRAEVERILEKLRAQGYASLTPGEREYMDRMAGS